MATANKANVAAKADRLNQTLPGERPVSGYPLQHANGWHGVENRQFQVTG
jgi:hypothetical protein